MKANSNCMVTKGWLDNLKGNKSQIHMEADRKIGWTFKRPYPAFEPVLWRRLLGTSMESSCYNKCVPGIIRVATPSPNRPRPISYFREGPQAQSSSEFATTLIGLREEKPKTALWDPIQFGDSTGDREADSSIYDLSFLKLSLHPFLHYCITTPSYIGHYTPIAAQ